MRFIKESEIEILWVEINVYGTAQRRSKDLMVILDEIMDNMVTANSAHWYCCVLRREDGHVKGILERQWSRK